MRALNALIAVAILLLVVYVGAGPGGLTFVFGVVLPYLAIALFLGGLVYRVLLWARAPVPFRVTTTCGQQWTLPWIKSSRLDNPHTTLGVIGRMALEVLLFRSLFRNTKVSLTPAQRVAYASDKYLWAGSLAFHWAFLIVFLRHLRFFLEPTPSFVGFLETWDGFFQLVVPTLFLTDLLIVVALTYLLARRLLNAQVRYISLPADYFALFMLLVVALSGIFMRYITKVDLVAVKQLCLGLVTFRPVVPEGIGMPFYIHLFFVCLLFAYFPFSKLMHMGGVFLSPTRNLANTNRTKRHINPWNPDIVGHTYEEWEEEFHDKLVAAGIPTERG